MISQQTFSKKRFNFSDQDTINLPNSILEVRLTPLQMIFSTLDLLVRRTLKLSLKRLWTVKRRLCRHV